MSEPNVLKDGEKIDLAKLADKIQADIVNMGEAGGILTDQMLKHLEKGTKPDPAVTDLFAEVNRDVSFAEQTLAVCLVGERLSKKLDEQNEQLNRIAFALIETLNHTRGSN